MATITLDSIRARIEEKYDATVVELAPGDGVRLLNPLRLPKERRAALKSFDKALSEAEDEEGSLQALRELLKVVAETEEQANRLLNLVDSFGGDSDVVLMEIAESYLNGQQAGEASPSES